MAQEAPKAKPAAAPAAAETAPAAAAGGGGGWLPVIVVLVAVPVLSFVMAEFVLFPRLEKRLAAGGLAPAAEENHAAKPAAGEHGKSQGEGHGAEGAEGGPAQSYEFKDIVSNLAGAMKSRYIKVTFTAYGSDPKFAEIVEGNRTKLLDTTLSVLGSLNLAETEDAGIKNKVRTSLVQAYHTLLQARVIEEVYFSEFVIQ
jgi:flagellar basal body-associated protein FliL